MNGSRVLFGAGWVVIVLQRLPRISTSCSEKPTDVSPISGLGEGQTEAVYVVGLALFGPLVLLAPWQLVTCDAHPAERRYLKLAAPGNAVASAS